MSNQTNIKLFEEIIEQVLELDFEKLPRLTYSNFNKLEKIEFKQYIEQANLTGQEKVIIFNTLE